jgi:hypothetical protein
MPCRCVVASASSSTLPIDVTSAGKSHPLPGHLESGLVDG